jgi:hypothetical protein|tara:strand:- start:43 stop:501 length:459 start_codon:yes stop_codon:yes gene_type:complete
MKKLLLAASVFTLSTSAMATSDELLNVKEATLRVIAHYIQPLTVKLNLTEIDFGDVYTDSVLTDIEVNTLLTGEPSETYEYKIQSNGVTTVLKNTQGTGTFNMDGFDNFLFFVNLNTTNLTPDQDLMEIVSVYVNYNEIASPSTIQSLLIAP